VHGQRECAHGCASPRLHPDASLPPQSQCASDNCNRNRCADKQALQSYCYKAQNCASNFCRNNRCVAAPGEATNGIGCNASVQCSSGYCQNRVCADKAADGSRCYKPQGCSSGFCINRRCAAKDNAPDGTTSRSPSDTFVTSRSGARRRTAATSAARCTKRPAACSVAIGGPPRWRTPHRLRPACSLPPLPAALHFHNRLTSSFT
jgi:hypothetical protein